jgi:hypothetical protein
MPELAKDSVALFAYLLPGLLAAWVLYGLTSQTKPSQFERVVQALIFTFIIQALLPLVHSICLAAGEIYVVRAWDKASEQIASFLLALLLGILLAYYTNTDSLHVWLRNKGLTTRTSYPSEWFGVFSQRVRYVVLHFNDERRLYGWPKEWPNESDKGHFYVMQPMWLSDDEKKIELPSVDGLLVSAKDVKWIEFMNDASEENKT